MSQVKLTKNELRFQKDKLDQLTRYLPTLQLKKSMLQQEINQVNQVVADQRKKFFDQKSAIYQYAPLFSGFGMQKFFDSLIVQEVIVEMENIAGLDVPNYKNLLFAPVEYQGAQVPLYWDYALEQLRNLIIEKEKLKCLETKKQLLEKELKEVSIRVNLFEKVLIPRIGANIKKIKIFLGDLQLSAVAQAKVAKSKIEAKRKRSGEIL